MPTPVGDASSSKKAALAQSTDETSVPTTASTTPTEQSTSGVSSTTDTNPPAPTAAAATATNDADFSNDTAVVGFPALRQSTAQLDWYTYHRGRAGQEPRDLETGEWQYDVPMPTDTHHNHDEPHWASAKCTIRFPLTKDNNNNGEREIRRSIFRDTVAWDWLGPNGVVVDGEAQTNGQLVSASTTDLDVDVLDRNPMEIAAAIAQEYGLTFAETVDIAEYMQSQLKSWVVQEASDAPPYILNDPSTGQRRATKSSTVFFTELYGQTTGMSSEDGGREERPGMSSLVQRSLSLSRRPSSVAESASHKKSTLRKSQKKASKKPLQPDEQCMEEIQRRLLLESTEEVKGRSPTEGPVGVLSIQKGLSCHLCQVSEGVFAQFACGQEGHSLCREHLKQKFAMFAVLDGDPVALGHCPICALVCSCDSCVATLEDLAIDFKVANSEQDCLLRETVVEDLSTKARTNRLDGSNRSKARFKRKSADLAERIVVPKVPATDLPREVCEGIDIDPGTDADYAATYTETGPVLPPGLSLSIKPADSSFSSKPSFAIEDGSVDFCNVCRKHGSLLCCDFCPRAFHAECMKASDVDDQGDGPWKCPSCMTEIAGLEGDKVDGSKSMVKICEAYTCSSGSKEDEKMLLLLASIHQMALYLIEYDFGYMFSEPVDTTQFSDYLDIVKRPMDLGTIATNLLNGKYRHTPEESLQSVALRVLQDIDQVWENCYLYNVDGSAVYRMALVQERRAKAVREVSFQHLLSAEMTESLGYEKSDKDLTASERPAVAIDVSTSFRPQKSRHKITVSKAMHNARPIAVLDPDTRKIVKIYSSIRAASAAIVFLLGLGHKCEWSNMEVETVQKVRRMLKSAHQKPTDTLFGYRWIILDNLRAGGVAFPKKPPSIPTDSLAQNPNPVDDRGAEPVQSADVRQEGKPELEEKSEEEKRNGLNETARDDPSGLSSPKEVIDLPNGTSCTVDLGKGPNIAMQNGKFVNGQNGVSKAVLCSSLKEQELLRKEIPRA